MRLLLDTHAFLWWKCRLPLDHVESVLSAPEHARVQLSSGEYFDFRGLSDVFERVGAVHGINATLFGDRRHPAALHAVGRRHR
jgi:hypothetical protein